MAPAPWRASARSCAAAWALCWSRALISICARRAWGVVQGGAGAFLGGGVREGVAAVDHDFQGGVVRLEGLHEQHGRAGGVPFGELPQQAVVTLAGAEVADVQPRVGQGHADQREVRRWLV